MMFNRTKSQSISINTIIIAAIALVVLIVIIVIFTGRVKIFSTNLEDCYAKQGDCKSGTPQNPCPEGTAYLANTKCDKKEEPYCCIQVLGSSNPKPAAAK